MNKPTSDLTISPVQFYKLLFKYFDWKSSWWMSALLIWICSLLTHWQIEMATYQSIFIKNNINVCAEKQSVNLKIWYYFIKKHLHTTKLRRKQFVPAKKKLQCRKKLCPFLTRHDFCINTCYKSLLHGRYWCCSSWTAQMQFAADFKLNYGTIPILRQQKDWMGGFGK